MRVLIVVGRPGGNDHRLGHGAVIGQRDRGAVLAEADDAGGGMVGGGGRARWQCAEALRHGGDRRGLVDGADEAMSIGAVAAIGA